jgi:hypothetical protein
MILVYTELLVEVVLGKYMVAEKQIQEKCKLTFLFYQILTYFFLFERYAMKCLDKKRIKMKQGETLALNERIMLSLVSTGVSR